MGELNMAGWLEDHATDAARTAQTGDLPVDDVQGQPEGDRGLQSTGNAFNDPLQLMLERTWGLLNRPKMHAHACCKCFHLRPCVQQPCAYRATDLEREWDCGCGKAA